MLPGCGLRGLAIGPSGWLTLSSKALAGGVAVAKDVDGHVHPAASLFSLFGDRSRLSGRSRVHLFCRLVTRTDPAYGCHSAQACGQARSAERKITNEIEFRGYFSLGAEEKRKLCFSLFNKKLNRGEWVLSVKRPPRTSRWRPSTWTRKPSPSATEAPLPKCPFMFRKASPSSPSRAGGAPGLGLLLRRSFRNGSDGNLRRQTPRAMPPRPENRPTLPRLAARASSGLSPAASSSRPACGTSPPPVAASRTGVAHAAFRFAAFTRAALPPAEPEARPQDMFSLPLDSPRPRLLRPPPLSPLRLLLPIPSLPPHPKVLMATWIWKPSTSAPASRYPALGPPPNIQPSRD